MSAGSGAAMPVEHMADTWTDTVTGVAPPLPSRASTVRAYSVPDASAREAFTVMVPVLSPIWNFPASLPAVMK